MLGLVARILISDPHPDIAQLFARAVALFGHDPTQDDNACVDGVIVDIDTEAGRRLARRASSAGLPVVCVSIHNTTAAQAALSPSAVLVKPFPLAELRAALDRALRASCRAPFGSAAGGPVGGEVVALDVLDHRALHREARREVGDRRLHHLDPALAVIRADRHDLLLEQAVELLASAPSDTPSITQPTSGE